jgi:hypothetical protein
MSYQEKINTGYYCLEIDWAMALKFPYFLQLRRQEQV